MVLKHIHQLKDKIIVVLNDGGTCLQWITCRLLRLEKNFGKELRGGMGNNRGSSNLMLVESIMNKLNRGPSIENRIENEKKCIVPSLMSMSITDQK